MKQLKISKDLSLPINFATKTAAILAQRRKGKTYTASVLAEEMVAAKQPFVALDPTGAWWGLRAAADGQQEGLPVIVLGGQHGDVPLERTGGRLIADLVVDEPGYYVIDFSLFESGEAERQFAVDFAERLYRAKGQPGKDFTLHLFVDEADRFVPQQMRKGSNETSPRLLGAFEAIVRRGGLRGLGTTLISQRAAVVNKNVLEMLDVLIALRTIGPNDRDAIDSYIKAHGTDAERKEMMASLASLEIGEAWVWEPGAEPALFQRVRIRRRHTFNSSATPEAGQKRVEPRRLAAVDLAKLQQRMAETIEKVKADDPKELKKQLAAARSELVKAQQVTATTQQASTAPGKVVEKPALTDADRKLIEKLAAQVAEIDDHARVAVNTVHADVDKRIKDLVADYGSQISGIWHKAAAELEERLEKASVKKLLEKLNGLAVSTPVPQPKQVLPNGARWADAPAPRVMSNNRTPTSTSSTAIASRTPSVGDTKLGKAERAILTVLANHRDGCDGAKLAILAGYTWSGTFSNAVGACRTAGYLTGPNTGVMQITAAGLEALGDYDPLPTGAALAAYWLNHRALGLAERKALQALIEAPSGLDKDRLCEVTGYAFSGTFSNALGKLRTIGVITGKNTEVMRAHPDLLEGR